MSKMSIRFILKSGAEFTMKCDEFTLNRNGLGALAGCEMKGIVENKPLHIDFSEVAAIVRCVADELGGP